MIDIPVFFMKLQTRVSVYFLSTGKNTKQMQVKIKDELLKEATQGLKNNVQNINKDILTQQSLIDIIDLKSVNNTQKIKKTEKNFLDAIKSLKKDRRNAIILILLLIISFLFFIVF